MTSLIDPTPQELAARFDAAGESPGRDWGDVLRLLGERREGVVTVDAGTPFGVCWWADRLGRRHWAVHPNPERPLADELTRVGDAAVWWYETQHPLEWIAPPLSCGWSERGGRREFVVICRCGVVGTPESIGWMGRTCGPCFDREQEGHSTLPPRPGIISQLLVTPTGRLLVQRRSVPESHQEASPHWTALAAYDRPWDGPPLWERSWDGYQRVAASEALAAVAHDGELELLDTRDGATRRTFRTGPEPILELAFAAPEQGTLVALDRERVRFWDVRGTVSWPSHVGRLAAPTTGLLAAHPDGSRVAVYTLRAIEVYDVLSGRWIERLDASFPAALGTGVYLNDGSFCVSDFRPTGKGITCRWAATPLPSGLLASLFGRRARRPDLAIEDFRGFFLATTGPFILSGGWSPLRLLDGQTLSPVASFTVGGGGLVGPAVFAPDGNLLVARDSALAVWPWREVFGVE
jgi:hypothetical protein